MALDHYVSQVHLRQFYSPTLGNRMYATKKSDLESFTCNSESVCRLEENSTNFYLLEPRVVEKFLLRIEPKYTASINKFRVGEIDAEAVFAIAGFASFVSCCAPAATRIRMPTIQEGVESLTLVLDRAGEFPKAPPALGGGTITDLIEDGTIHFVVDNKYPQAVGISNFIDRVSLWGNSYWEVLLNGASDSPFFTSDYPIALEAKSYWSANWIVPLAPDIAVRIVPDWRLRGSNPDLSFSKFRYRRQTLQRGEILKINRLIVRSAENLVFYRDDLSWIPGFIEKNRHYRIEAEIFRVPYGNGFQTKTRQRIVYRIQPETMP